MFINLGAMDFGSKKELVSMIAEYGGIGDGDISEVTISKRNSTFTVDKGLVKGMSAKFRDAEYNGHALRVNPDGDEGGGKKKGKKKKGNKFEGKRRSSDDCKLDKKKKKKY